MAQQTIAETLATQLRNDKQRNIRTASSVIITSKARWNTRLFTSVMYCSDNIDDFDAVFAHAISKFEKINDHQFDQIFRHVDISLIKKHRKTLQEKATYNAISGLCNHYNSALMHKNDEMIDLLFQLGYQSCDIYPINVFYGISLHGDDSCPNITQEQEFEIIAYMQRIINTYGKDTILKSDKNYVRLTKELIAYGLPHVLSYVKALGENDENITIISWIFQQKKFTEIIQDNIRYNSIDRCPISRLPEKLLQIMQFTLTLPGLAHNYLYRILPASLLNQF